jgi:sarcosine oxidase subunit beta
MNRSYDAVVVGGGVVGTSTAFHLAKLGLKRVLLCERQCLAGGASGKSNGLVRMHYANEPEARLAVASLSYFHHWAELVGHGSPGFLKTGVVRIVSPENEAKLRRNVARLRELGVNTWVIGPEELSEIAPYWRADDITAAAYEPDSGCADPVGTTFGFAVAAQRLGVEIWTQTEVTDIRVAGGKAVAVETSKGPVSAPIVVIAGGPWALSLLRQLGLEVALTPVRVQLAVFRRPPAIGEPHPVGIDGINRMTFRVDGPGGVNTIVSASVPRPVTDPEVSGESADSDYIPWARAQIARRIPAMADAPARGAWSGVIVLSPDGKPVIDRHPEIEGVYFFTADSGTSFKTAPAIGLGLAEWVVRGRPVSVDLRPFRASRFAEGKLLVGEDEYADTVVESVRSRLVAG